MCATGRIMIMIIMSHPSRMTQWTGPGLGLGLGACQ
jgi:hypothetical protein